MSHEVRMAQIEELRRKYQRVSQVCGTDRETTLEVEHVPRDRGYTLNLYVTVDNNFPRSEPIITTFNGRLVSFAPPGLAEKTPCWTPGTSTLAGAVSYAFDNLATLWGNVVPPTLSQVTSQLSSQPDEVLEDIVNNQNCLETFAHQLPFMKDIREASRQTLDDVERVALENLALQPELESLQEEIKRLQTNLASQLSELENARSVVPLVTAVGTPEALAKTIAKDVGVLDEECEQLGRELMGVSYADDKRRFTALLEQLKQRSKERHMLDLKRRAYNASIRTK